MTFPSFFLGLLISTLYGALFHLIRGGGLGRLLFYLILAWIGFWGGHLLADWLGWSFGMLGPLNLGLATILSLIVLVVGYWLSLIEVDRTRE
ncbi:MAG: hypothetical protein MUP03_09840 [Anaerolineales bacterium]|nr:hypothetical protein [Anaerolineales bacterium]